MRITLIIQLLFFQIIKYFLFPYVSFFFFLSLFLSLSLSVVILPWILFSFSSNKLVEEFMFFILSNYNIFFLYKAENSIIYLFIYFC